MKTYFKGNKVIAERALMDMANIFPTQTGFKQPLWLDVGAIDRPIPHNKHRLKYGNHREVTITFFSKGNYTVKGDTSVKKSDFPDIDRVTKWVDVNYDALVKLYSGEDGNKAYGIMEFLKEMKRV